MTPQKPTGPPGLHVLLRWLRPLLVVIAVVVNTDRHGVVQGAEDQGNAASTLPPPGVLKRSLDQRCQVTTFRGGLYFYKPFRRVGFPLRSGLTFPVQ